MKWPNFRSLFGARAESDVPRASAVFDAFSLTASYDFTLEQMKQTANIGIGERLPDIMRAGFHELFHLYQALATPYGYFYQCLRDMQANLAGEAIRALQDIDPTKIRAPLIGLLRDPRLETDAPHVYQALAFCYNSEILLLFLQSEINVYCNVLRSPILPHRTVSFRFLANERCLVPFLNRVGRTFTYSGPQIAEASDANERFFNAMRIFGPSPDVRFVLESAANVAEYWNYELLPDWTVERSRSQQDGRYWDLVLKAKAWLRRITTCNEFVWTYLALSDFALNSPLLPFHADLRQGYSDVTKLTPVELFHRLLRAAVDLVPIREPVTDYERFIGELTAATGVASPVDLARATVQRLKSSPDPVTKAFHYAQAVRNAAPWAFLDHRIWIDEPINDIMARFRAIFIHPVMQFRDQTLYHRDKGLCLVYVGRFVMNTFCRKLLFAGDTVVKLPFRAPPEELKFLREETLSVLHSVGINGLELYLESA